MTEKELRKMRPQDIIQLLVVQGNEASQLQAEIDLKKQRVDLFQSNNEVLKAKLNDRDALTELLKIRLDISDARIREQKGKMAKERSEKWIEVEEAGSIEKASRELEAIFKAAQQEANQYMGIEEEEEPEEEENVVEEIPVQEEIGGMLVMPPGARTAGTGAWIAGAGAQPAGTGAWTAGAGAQPAGAGAALSGVWPAGAGTASSKAALSGARPAAYEAAPSARASAGKRTAESGMPGGSKRVLPSGAQTARKRAMPPGVQGAGSRTALSGGKAIQSDLWIDAGIVMPDVPPETRLSQPDMRIAAALGLSSVHVESEAASGAPEASAARKMTVKKANKGIFGTLRTRKRRS